ncbi:hypothetical protein FACS189434_06050 [Bacteroidia bacterium]|nr:hypothetical protein FACS189434_06050 [Bacteroidia bacterium]
MKKYLTILIAIFLSLFPHLSAQNGVIYGKIVDSATGERISNAQISVLYNGEAVGQPVINNGQYSFNANKAGNYSIKVVKAEYNTFSGSVIASLGDSMRRDIALEKPPRFLKITEVNNNSAEIKEIDFGAVETFGYRYVDLFNSGTTALNYTTGKTKPWIVDVSPSSGTLQPNESQRITIKVEGAKLEAGETSGKMLVMSNNGNAVLGIKAIGKYPKVTMLSVTRFDRPDNDSPNTFRGEIETIGANTYSKRGFCFSSISDMPIIEDENCISVVCNTYGDFIYRDYWVDDQAKELPPFPWNTWEGMWATCQPWHVRAWVTYDRGNGKEIVIYSDNVIKFIRAEFMCKYYEED